MSAMIHVCMILGRFGEIVFFFFVLCLKERLRDFLIFGHLCIFFFNMSFPGTFVFINFWCRSHVLHKITKDGSVFLETFVKKRKKERQENEQLICVCLSIVPLVQEVRGAEVTAAHLRNPLRWY